MTNYDTRTLDIVTLAYRVACHNKPVGYPHLVDVCKSIPMLEPAYIMEVCCHLGLDLEGGLSHQEIDELLTKIAKEELRIETLKERRLDSLDFHEVSVWGLKAALLKAFTLGQINGRK